jgi:hypothetical protein
MSGATKPSAPRVAALRERRAALGLVRVEVYVHPDDAQPIRDYAQRLAHKRKKSPDRVSSRGE